VPARSVALSGLDPQGAGDRTNSVTGTINDVEHIVVFMQETARSIITSDT